MTIGLGSSSSSNVNTNHKVVVTNEENDRSMSISETETSSSKTIHARVVPFPDPANAFRSFLALVEGTEVLCKDVFTSMYSGEEMARWREAEIVAVNDNIVTIHFVGWADKHDIKLDMSSHDGISRIAPISLSEAMSEEDLKRGRELRDSEVIIHQHHRRCYSHCDHHRRDAKSIAFQDS